MSQNLSTLPTSSPDSYQRNVGCIIVAAGRSKRMNGRDKCFALIAGKPLISYTIDVFQKNSLVHKIILALHKDNMAQGQKLLRDFGWSKLTNIYLGGVRRQDSVAYGLPYLRDCHWIMVHDGSRPCLHENLIERGLICAQETGAAVAAIPVTDTIKLVDEGYVIQETPIRKNLWLAQTPQVFRRDVITTAYDRAVIDDIEATDDASLVEKTGYQVKIYPGSYDNIKITTTYDLALAEIILDKEKKVHHYVPSTDI